MSAKKSKLQLVTLCAVFAALTFALTFINIRLPLPGNGGLIHFGNIPVVVAAIVFGKKYSAISGALGMTLFDLVGGWVLWAPFTFIIRLAVGYLIGLLAEKGHGVSIKWNIAAVILGGIVMIAGYYTAECILYGNFIAPLSSIPGDITQTVSMIILGIPFGMTLKRSLPKSLTT